MHKSFSMQKAVKKVIWERDSWENYQRLKGKTCFSLYLHTHLVAGFLAQELCTLSFLEAFSCSHSAIKHLNMLQIWWEGVPKFHLGSLIVKQDPGNTEPIFSLCCLLPGISEGTQGWDGGSQEEPALWWPQLTTHPLKRWDKEMGGSTSHPAWNEKLSPLTVLSSGVNFQGLNRMQLWGTLLLSGTYQSGVAIYKGVSEYYGQKTKMVKLSKNWPLLRKLMKCRLSCSSS